MSDPMDTIQALAPMGSSTDTTLVEGRKYDGGKSPLWQGCLQYFPLALQEVAKVSKYGTEKYEVPYSDLNFLRVENGVERYMDGLARHIAGLAHEGEINHQDGELLHRGQIAWCALAMLECYLREQEKI